MKYLSVLLLLFLGSCGTTRVLEQTIIIVNNSTTELSHVVIQSSWPRSHDNKKESSDLFIDHLGLAKKAALVFKGDFNGQCISLRSEKLLIPIKDCMRSEVITDSVIYIIVNDNALRIQ